MMQTTDILDLEEMYIIKVKGKAKIPDYVQIRDQDFVLVAYFRTDRPLKRMDKFGLEGKDVELKDLIKSIPYGKLQKLII
jgi:hypothetical protein